MPVKRYSRKQLLQALGDCQNLFGQIQALNHDRNPNRAAQVEAATKFGFESCVKVLSTEPPVEGTVFGRFDKTGIM